MQRTSTYNKVREIINAASRHKGNVAALANSIKGNSDAFVYFKRDRDGIVKEHPCNEASIRRKIRFCIRLGLVNSEENCTLTAEGENARMKGRFGLQLQTAVNSFLEKNAVPVSKIESAINKLILPHASALSQYLKPAISEDLFRTCLFLLSECGKEEGQNILKSFDKKLYLTDAKIKRVQNAMEK